MGKGRYLKSAERSCATKARFETAQEAERTSEYRYRAYRCPVCHGFHLTSRSGTPLSTPEPVVRTPEPKGPKLGDLDWSALLEPNKPKPSRPAKPVRPKPVPAPPPRLAQCLGPCGKDGKVPLLIEGRLVKSTRTAAYLRNRIARGIEVSVTTQDPPEILAIVGA